MTTKTATGAADETPALEETETSSTVLQGGGIRQVTHAFAHILFPVPYVL